MSKYQDFVALIRDRLSKNRDSIRATAIRSGIPVRSLHSLLNDGRVPSINRAAEICDAVGLEFYIGPPRQEPDPSRYLPTLMPEEIERPLQELVGAVLNAGGNPIPKDWWPTITGRDDYDGLPWYPNDESDVPAKLAKVDSEVVSVPFADEVWAYHQSEGVGIVDATGLRVEVPNALLPEWVCPSDLVCIWAAGDAMEPTLHDGDLMLFDYSWVDPVDGQVFLLLTEDGLVVKRLSEDDEGWVMTSDNPAYGPRALKEEDRAAGRLAWSGPLPSTKAGG